MSRPSWDERLRSGFRRYSEFGDHSIALAKASRPRGSFYFAWVNESRIPANKAEAHPTLGVIFNDYESRKILSRSALLSP